MLNIAVIEDDERLREILVAMLERAVYQVMCAATGKEGIALIRAEPPDLVITDIVMPEADGIEVLTSLRKEFPTIPVIAISGGGYNSPLYLKTAKSLGARLTLAKPFSPEDLLDAISKAVEPLPSSASPLERDVRLS